MKMPKQIRYRKLGVLKMRSERCMLDDCVLLATIQFEMLSFSNSYINAEIYLPFKKCAVSTQYTPSFWGEGTCIVNKMSPKLDRWGEIIFLCWLWKTPLDSQKGLFLMLTPKATMAQYALWCENTLSSFAYPPAFCYQHRLNSLLTRDLLDSGSLTPVLPVC